MPKGPPPAWRQRKQPVRDDYLMASISHAGGKHDGEGHYATLVVGGCATREEAQEEVRALNRCAMYLKKQGIADIGVSCKIRKRGDVFDVEFFAVDKAMARKYVIETYGPDPAKWPYNARRRGPSNALLPALR